MYVIDAVYSIGVKYEGGSKRSKKLLSTIQLFRIPQNQISIAAISSSTPTRAIANDTTLDALRFILFTSIFTFPLFIFLLAACPALLHPRSRSILSLFLEVSDAHLSGREVLHPRIHLHGNIFHFGERATIRSEALLRAALALHRAVSRRPHRGHLRRAAPAQRFLHGRHHWRRPEQHRFWQHLESDFP